MKKNYKIGGGYYCRLLSLCCAMFSYSLAASAQSGTGATSASSAGSTSASSTAPAGVEGYRIAGEARPAEPSKAYEYTREMLDGSDGVYWHIEGATAINDGPPKLYPGGNLDANILDAN